MDDNVNDTSPCFGLECVQKREEAAKLIMQWRNDPETLRWSFNSHPKSWPSFYSEFLSTYFSSPLGPFFALLEGERVAFIRFRQEVPQELAKQGYLELSLNMAPQWRGKGLAVPLLKQLRQYCAESGYPLLYAEIKEGHTASHRIFAKAGFQEIAQKTKGGGLIKQYIAAPAHYRPRQGVFIIAEAGSNWRVGSERRDKLMAKALIDAAVDAGADAVKFQTYRPETVYVANAGASSYLEESGIKEDIRDIFSDLAMPYELIPELHDYCQKQNIAFMSTAFSPKDFAAIDPFVSAHKIASYEISHLRLLELAAKSQKPLILSTGASTEEDIAWAVNFFYEQGGTDLTLLQCTAKYPADLSSLNLKVIPWLKRRFQVQSGLSDHSRDPIYAPLAAVALGATCIEKHYTLHNALPGPDHSFAITADELKLMVQAIRAGEKMLGSGVKEILDAEQELAHFARRGLQVTQPVEKGERFFEEENIAILRPGKQPLGLHPRFLAQIQGKKAVRSLALGEGIREGDWENDVEA